MLKKYLSILQEGEALSHMSHAETGMEEAAEVLHHLEDEDEFFRSHTKNHAPLTDEVRHETAEHGQHPYAVVITCSDSRVPPEHIFQAGIGDLFVIRNAGNVLGDFDLGSVEYAVEHLGCKVVVVMGHTHCGAVDAAMHGHEHGFVGTIIHEIREAIGDETDPRRGELRNVSHSLAKLAQSDVLSRLHKEGKVYFVGAIYDIETGNVHFLDENDGDI